MKAWVAWRPSLTSAIEGGEWPASLSGLLTPEENDHDAHQIRGKMGCRAELES
jgi:hypothetical protein